MKGWSSGKKPTVQEKKTIKSQILRAFLKLHPLTATIWQLCKLFTLTVYMYIFWGKILFSAKRTHRSVAMLQMDLVLLTLCDSPVFGVCFCHTLIGWADVSHANCLPPEERFYVCSGNIIKRIIIIKNNMQLTSSGKWTPTKKYPLYVFSSLRKPCGTWVLGIIQLLSALLKSVLLQ